MNKNADYNKINRNREKVKKSFSLKKIVTLQAFVFLVVGSIAFSLIFIPGNRSLADFRLQIPDIISEERADPSTDKADYSPLVKKLTYEISSSNAILVDLASGETIAEKSPDARIYPASITKVMTSILVLEHYSDLETLVEVPYEIFAYLIEQNASVAGFSAGEKVRVIDLLYGILLPSGADACLALAYSIAGNETAFALKMTEKAREIGALNTNFKNSTGLHVDGHYSTVRDLSVIFRYALKNDTFRKIITTEKYTTAPTNKHPYGVTVSSTVFKAFERANLKNLYVKGGKTGFTDEARLCLASLGEKNGKEYVLITVGAGDGLSSRGTQHVSDAGYIYSNCV